MPIEISQELVYLLGAVMVIGLLAYFVTQKMGTPKAPPK